MNMKTLFTEVKKKVTGGETDYNPVTTKRWRYPFKAKESFNKDVCLYLGALENSEW